MCYRYTIPQSSAYYLAESNSYGVYQIVNFSRLRKPADAAPFYPLPPGLGKRAAMLFVEGGPRRSAVVCGVEGAVVRGRWRVSVYFEELDFRPTPMGVLSLRRRRQLTTGADVYEIKLGDEFLMSSQFTKAEIELARLGLAALGRGNLDVVVGGLGLGYTAQAVLENPDVRSLIVVDALAEVIEWHQQGLLPLGRQLTGDPRCRLVNGDFFALSESDDGFDTHAPRRLFDAVLVDIDHSPRNLLHPGDAALYRPEGLARLVAHLRPGGVFAQ